MLKVGLTGGIACGKTNVLKEFDRLGVFGVDADQVSRDIMQPGGSAYGPVVELFGQNILRADNSLDRGKIGEIVFANSEKRLRLEALVHPLILEEQERILVALEDKSGSRRTRITMVDAALMVETGSYQRYDLIVVVYCHPEIQLRRLMTRDHLPEEEAQSRLDSQMDLSEKVRYGDFVIDNSGRLSDTKLQVQKIFHELVSRL